MKSPLFFISGLLVVSLSPSAARDQTVRVRGKLMCGTQAVTEATVKMWDEDTFSRDDEMGSVMTNSQGEFELSGMASDPIGTTVEPYLEVLHKCNYGRKYGSGKKRKTEFYIPSRYVNTDQAANIGVVNLEIRYRSSENSWRFF